MSLLWIFGYLLLERFFELYLSRRHWRLLAVRGGREFYPETFPRMVALHCLFLLALFVESYPWHLPIGLVSVALLIIFMLLQLVRYWCMVSLGEFWNTRIVLIPGGMVKKSGPYRWLPHPNYLVVTMEFILLPLLMHSPYTLALFFPASLLIIGQRIRLEEKSLREFTDYNIRFSSQ